MSVLRRSLFIPLQRPVTTAVVLGFLILVTVGVKARVWRQSAPMATSQEQASRNTRGRAEIVRFTVYDAGIFPRELRATPGLIQLRFEDMSGNSDGLVLVNETQQTLAHVVRPPRRLRDNKRISLAPGRYTVYDASRPANRATLIIEQ